ncbi:MnhB domain-containing protein [Actinomadura terrae]|uniref:MnhB domain-containing protein n=1 Tax=Actinomadura terrae TaxID=604353 RepID=UPI001FA72AF0|nr:MnhB domain-containing protein [Actinomadura terrae]
MRPRGRLALFAAGTGATAALVVQAFRALPEFGGAFHPYSDRAVPAGLAQDTKNIVSSVNFDQRAFDTVGEELILLAAALGAVVLLRAVRDEYEAAGGELRHGPADVSDALRLAGLVLLPVTLVVGVYVIAHGNLSPGGGFQGGVVLGTAVHLLYLAGDYPTLRRLRPMPAFEVGEASAAAVFVLLALAASTLAPDARGTHSVPALNAAVGAEVGCALVLVLARFFEQALLINGGRTERT